MSRKSPSAPRNPFSYGALALDEAFADREREAQELKADILNGQDVVIFAPRRYGKSSLVWRVMAERGSAGPLVAYVNLMTAPTKQKLAEKLASALFESVATPLERVRERALAPFRELRIVPTVTVDPGAGSYSFSFGVDHAGPDIDATLERLLELPAVLGADKDRPVAVIFDEFQEVETIDRSLPRLMRTIFEQQPEVSHVYLGSRRHLMERLFNDENEPFWRSAKKVELGTIPARVFAAFIVDRFAATRKRVSRELADDLLARTGGHPYATQELAYFLWEETPFDASAAELDLDAAVAAVLRSEHAHFQVRWDDAAVTQKLILGALAREQGRPMTNDYRARHGLPPVSAIQVALRALVERELIAKQPDASYRIAEPFFDLWINAL